MANQKGPKVQNVTKGGKAKAADEKAEKREAAKAEKEQKKAAKAEQKEAAKAEKAKKKEEAQTRKAQKKEAAQEEKAAKKQSKGEKAKAVKIARDGEEGGKAGGKKKKVLLAVVAVLLVVLIAGSVFFLVRMLRKGGKDTTASLPPSSSESPISVGGAGGAAPEEGAAEPEESSSAAEPEKDKDASKGKDAAKDKDASSKGAAKDTAGSGSQPASDESAPPASLTPEEAKALSAQAAQQAVEGSAGTANVAAMLGSGAVPQDARDFDENAANDKPKPGQIVSGKAAPSGNAPSGASPEAAPQAKAPEQPEESRGTALTSPTETQAVPDFKFSDASLNLPRFTYNASNTQEAAVHRDVGEYLESKDDRPGVQITAVAIGGQIALPDGGTRVLAYAWGSRYAIAENTLFDYGNLVGPCALDYRGGALQKITLARPGDQFESSVREFCGDREDVADRMVNQSYDLELRGQMLRNVSDYIRANSIPVDFFRASGQVYNTDGTIYLPPQAQEPPAETQDAGAADAAAAAASEAAAAEEAALRESYRTIQEMPE